MFNARLIYQLYQLSLLYVPAFQLRANSRERFVIELPPETLQLLAVGKTVDSRLPGAIMDTSALIGEHRDTNIYRVKGENVEEK